MKTNKSFTKRIRVTKKGKLIARTPGQDHFNAKEGSKKKGRKKGNASVVMGPKTRARFLSGTGA